MTHSDPIRPLITQPAEDVDRLPDIDYHNIKKAAMVLRALNHKLRQQVLKTIHENKRIDVTDLYVKLRLEQSVASQHLSILRKSRYFIHGAYWKIYFLFNQFFSNRRNKCIRK